MIVWIIFAVTYGILIGGACMEAYRRARSRRERRDRTFHQTYPRRTDLWQ